MYSCQVYMMLYYLLDPHVILGRLYKSYASIPTLEISQLCYKALLRTIAFSTTQCVGSIIDPHSQVCHSCQFNNTNQATIGDSQESQLYTNEVSHIPYPHLNVNNWNRHFLTSTTKYIHNRMLGQLF